MRLEDVRRSAMAQGREKAVQTGLGLWPAKVLRFAFLLQILVLLLAFGISWVTPGRAGAQRLWLSLPGYVSAQVRLDLGSAIIGVTLLAIVFATAGAALKTWADASAIAAEGTTEAHARGLVAAGPFRRLRDPMGVGQVLLVLAVSLLLTWEGALFAVIATILLESVFARGRDEVLLGTYGEAAKTYIREVPRWFPRLHSWGQGGAGAARWARALLREIGAWGTAVTFGIFGWNYNSLLVTQGVLVSVGLSIAVRGLLREDSPQTA